MSYQVCISLYQVCITSCFKEESLSRISAVSIRRVRIYSVSSILRPAKKWRVSVCIESVSHQSFGAAGGGGLRLANLGAEYSYKGGVREYMY